MKSDAVKMVSAATFAIDKSMDEVTVLTCSHFTHLLRTIQENVKT